MSASHDVSDPIPKDTWIALPRSTNDATASRRKIMPEDGLVRSSPSLSLKKGDGGGGICNCQILMFVRITTRISFHQDRSE